MSRDDHHFPSLMLLPPGLLAAAHLMTFIAIFSFETRTGGYPLHPAGLILYGVVTVLTVIGLAVQACRAKSVSPDTASLLLISAPALVSLVFRAGLWMTPFLGGAPYAPYDPGDSDIVLIFNLLFATLFSIVAVVYGSFIYLAVTCAVETALYLGTHAVPHRVLYPGAHILGVRPSTFISFFGIYAVGTVLLLMRIGLSKRQGKHGLWLAATLTGLAGAWVLYGTLVWLPRNGAYLGYVDASVYVPDGAWDWTRLTAQGMAVMAMAAAVLNGPLACVAGWTHRLEE